MSETWADDQFSYRIGTSVISEFAVGHTPSDVLRELVQNEYDAGGRELIVEFGRDVLTIRGTGNVIDRAGWNRLSVMLGTGLVAGTNAALHAKVNGIGSKNFGLRSLFLFGDEICVQSGGRQTVLNRSRGTLREPKPHDESRDKCGITIVVPYREKDDGDLRAFTEEREHDALVDMVKVLAPSLVKLAVPKAKKSMAMLSVSSDRLDHRISWTQTVRVLKEPRSPLLRTVRIRQEGAPLGELPSRYSEVEYTGVALPPPDLRGRPTPSYFRVPGGRIRIGVSFALDRRRIVSSPGIFYYPLGAVRARTGAHFSVNAPFVMNEDRSQLLDPDSHDWNAWLIGEAAALTVSLLPDLFNRYGANAYGAVRVAPEYASVARLAADVSTALAENACWPSQAKDRDKPLFCQASALTLPIPELRDLGKLLNADAVMNDSVSTDEAASQLALDCGAKPFTVNSLVRLRCAGENASELRTKVDGANWYFANFPGTLYELDTQVQFARALDRVKPTLSPANRADLVSSPTTLTSAGGLAAPDEPLWVVDAVLADAVPATTTTTLHPALASFQILKSLCKPFAVSRWVIATAQAAADGYADEESIKALRKLVLDNPKLSNPAWASLRRAPVFLDHRGELAAPSELIVRGAPGAALLEPVLRFAPNEIARRRELVRTLRISTSVHGDDLLRLAAAVEEGRVSAAAARSAFEKHARLLSPAVLGGLRRVRFLETTIGTTVSPASAYERNERTAVALGADHPWPLASYGALLAKLKLRSEPSVEDIVDRLRVLQASGVPLPHSELVYRVLHEVARSEQVRLAKYSAESVIWTGRSWAAPKDCLVGTEYRQVFGEAIPVLTKPREVLLALGAPIHPTPIHWLRLFNWIRKSFGRTVPQRVREAALYAYEHLDALPREVPADWAVLLDEHGQLHMRAAASQQSFLIDDDPLVAEAVRRSDRPAAFAIPDPAAHACLRASGVMPLSEISRLEAVLPGAAVEGADPRVIPGLLARLADPDFASAVAALAAAECGPAPHRRPASLERRFRSVQGIDIVENIVRRHRVGTFTVTTHVDHYVDDTRILVTNARTQDELRQAVARAVTAIIDSSDQPNRLLPDAIYFLMRCRTRSELARELEKRRIPWRPTGHATLWGPEDEEDDEPIDPDVAAVGDAISRTIMLGANTSPTTPSPPAPTTPTIPTPPPTVRNQLPDLNQVRPTVAEAAPSLVSRTGKPGGNAPATATPRTPQQVEDDQHLGCRGEEIVFRYERDRVAARGQDPAEVVWVAAANPVANYDIRSVDAEGREIWIEVKATAGRTGRFSWPKSEFLLAVSKRRRYYLYRIYEADTTSPTIVQIQDPFGRFQRGLLSVDLDVLAADIGPMV
jgi:hypothetical protein